MTHDLPHPRLPPRPSNPEGHPSPTKGHAHGHLRRSYRRSEALERHHSYNTYINGVLLGSDLTTATRFFESLSPSQQRRVLNDPAFERFNFSNSNP